MKLKSLKVLVLLVSVSAASVLIWNASRDQKPQETQEESTVDPRNMQVSPKSGPMLGSDDISLLGFEPFLNYGTEIQGIPADASEVTNLIPSSKSIDAILTRKDIEGVIEGHKTEKNQEPHLIPSSKNPNRLLDPEDVEQIIEAGASDFIKPQEPEK